MIVHPENTEAEKLFGASHGFKFFVGAHYLRGYIGDEESKCGWFKDWTGNWEINVCVVAKMAGKYLQENYATVVRKTQS